MDFFEKEKYDYYKVVFLEILGNVRLDYFYDYIVFYINSINFLWVKRVGCYVLRKYEYDYVIFKEFFFFF